MSEFMKLAIGFVLFFMGQRIYDFERKTSLIICCFTQREK